MRTSRRWPAPCETTVDRGPSNATTTTGARDCRKLSADDPLRLWIGGDSLAGSLGPELGKLAGETGVVQPYFDSRVSSGLADPGFFDWPDHATTEMARLNPEVVAFIIGTNDWTAVSGDWKSDYTAKVESTMKTLTGSGRTVYWLGAPTLKDEKMDAAVVEVNAVAQEVAKRHPKVHYVDTYKLFSDTDGTFAYDLPIEDGTTVTMRARRRRPLHHGRRRLPRAPGVQARRRAVRRHRAEGRRPDEAGDRDRGQHAGRAGFVRNSNNNSSGSSRNSGGGTVQTTPPATAPPTSPPETRTAGDRAPPTTTHRRRPPPPPAAATP